MVLDESSAKAILKRDCKIFLARIQRDKLPPMRSRKTWCKRTLNDIRNTNYIISESTDNERFKEIIALTPLTENGHFFTSVYSLDLKKCLCDVDELSIRFTQHSIIRLMQTFSERNLHKLAPMLRIVIDSIIDKDVDLDKDGEYDLYAEHLGLLPFVIENRELYIKTLVPKDMLCDLQLINYKKAPFIT